MMRLTLAVIAIFTMCNVFAGVLSSSDLPVTGDWQGFGNMEFRVLKPLAPLTFDIGLCEAIQLTTLPTDWIIVGGRKIFADIAYTTQNALLWGGSISLKPAVADDGLRGDILFRTDTHTVVVGVSYATKFDF